MRHAEHIVGWELHSQYLPFPHEQIPADAVLAYSARWFRPHHHSSRDETLEQRLIEVIEFGARAFGIQAHPEITPEILKAFTVVPPFSEILEREGVNLEFQRELIDEQMNAKRRTAGRAHGFNWTKYFCLPYYMGHLLANHELTREQEQRILQDLVILKRRKLTYRDQAS